MGKVIGIGGIFFKFQDEKEMKNWYKEALGLNPNDYGILFRYNGNSHPSATLQLGTFPATTDYFGNPNQQAMINFRVDDMISLKAHLEKMNVVIVNEIQEYDFGKFLHIEDPEGNRIELWEPVDGPFDGETQVEMR